MNLLPSALQLTGVEQVLGISDCPLPTVLFAPRVLLPRALDPAQVLVKPVGHD